MIDSMYELGIDAGKKYAKYHPEQDDLGELACPFQDDSGDWEEGFRQGWFAEHGKVSRIARLLTQEATSNVVSEAEGSREP